MRNRNFFFILLTVVVGALVFLAFQTGTSKSYAASQNLRQNPTAAATEDNRTAICEALRTIPKEVATPAPNATPEAEVEIARPSNPGGPGEALKLFGDAKAGEKVYVDSCQKCHGEQGVGKIENPGSDDGTIPELNPIDETLVDIDPLVYACNLDLFVEHGSVPSGPSPKETMQPWGDNKVLTSQQIADVIAYVITLNGGTPATAVPTPAK
jgi:mono/diheme cytochrome c family protein